MYRQKLVFMRVSRHLSVEPQATRIQERSKGYRRRACSPFSFFAAGSHPRAAIPLAHRSLCRGDVLEALVNASTSARGRVSGRVVPLEGQRLGQVRTSSLGHFFRTRLATKLELLDLSSRRLGQRFESNFARDLVFREHRSAVVDQRFRRDLGAGA